jgi:2-keto-4-pentenoate hydratase/2-oxohepta-3-ene-1,7-dioic acid hydratase in catechol pathway
MRFVRFGEPGTEIAGLLVDETVFDISSLLSTLYSRPGSGWDASFFARLGEIHSARLFESCPSHELHDVRLGPPVAYPSKVVCVGLNYLDHALEQGKTPPEKPLLFAKAPSCITGPQDSIIKPADTAQLDYEVELAAVIGSVARNVHRESARDYVAGYMVMNDITARDIQKGEKQWFRGKSFDSFAPSGPWLTSPVDAGDIQNAELTLTVNGELRQSSSTAKMIFDVEYLVSYISRSMTLLPGDIISTGTPPGVGVFRDPPLFLSPGDVVEAHVEGLGTLRNVVTSPQDP